MAESTLIDELSDDKLDERTGIEAIRGFSFQVWWATCQALELLKTNEDFVVVLEYKQDVAVLDSSDNPTCLAFYQIKKSEGVSSAPWAISKLLAHDKDTKKSPKSILGKLFQHRPRFSQSPVTLAFITNCGFSYGKPKIESEKIELTDLPSELLKTVKEKIANDLSVEKSAVDLSNFRLERTHVPLELPQRWACGILDEVERAVIPPFLTVLRSSNAMQPWPAAVLG